MPYDITLPGGTTITLDEPTGGNGVVDFSNGSTIGTMVPVIMTYVFAFAGIILFFSFIFAGFTMLTSVGDPQKLEKGKQMVVASLIGFVVIFLSYWIMQLLQYVLGLGFGF